MTKRCRHRWCKQRFDAPADDILFCPRCRELLLAAERAYTRNDTGAQMEAIATTEFWKEWRSPFDYKVIDENGREVWASDLIKKYKHETRPRPI